MKVKVYYSVPTSAEIEVDDRFTDLIEGGTTKLEMELEKVITDSLGISSDDLHGVWHDDKVLMEY